MTKLLDTNTQIKPDLQVCRYTFVEIKAYGDLTIAASMLSLLPRSVLQSCTLLVSPHLTELANVLKPGCNIETLSLPKNNKLPAFFDIKNRGFIAGLSSALSLRKALSNAASDSILVMPKLGGREKFILGRRHSVALPKSNNIYTAFEIFFINNLNVSVTCNKFYQHIRNQRIAICPFSRVSIKNIPTELIFELIQICSEHGFEIELLFLEGENPKELDCLSKRIIPRRFDVLADALRGYDAIISADSLPAHLAEHMNVPTFVVSPRPNSYWMPPRVLEGLQWGVLTQHTELIKRLNFFLENIKNSI